MSERQPILIDYQSNTNTNIKKAWVTYLSNTAYLQGCLVLAYSLRKVHSQYPLLVMVPSYPPLDDQDLDQLKRVSNIVLQPIDISCWHFSPPSPTPPLSEEGQAKKAKKEIEYLFEQYAHTWAKLGAWGLTEYRRLVLVDCDMLVRYNMDQLLNDPPITTAITTLAAAENKRKLELGHLDAYLDLPEGWVAAAHACTCNPMRFSQYPPSWTPESCAYSQYTGNPCPPSHNDPLTAANNKYPSSTSSSTPEDLPLNDSNHILPKRSYFNSGLVVLTPSLDQLDIFLRFFQQIRDPSEFLFPDQDLLNKVYQGRWLSLGYGYNALKTLSFAHSPIWTPDLFSIASSLPSPPSPTTTTTSSSSETKILPMTSPKPTSSITVSSSLSPPSPPLTPPHDNAVQEETTRSLQDKMPVLNIHYILEKPWNVPNLETAQQESNRFVDLYRWWWQAHDELAMEYPH